jgi:hypothetical protein
MKHASLALTLSVGMALGTAHASPPTAVDIDAGFSFAEYTGSAAVGRGDVSIASTLFYIDEKVAGGWKSWYLFADPGVSQGLVATLHFDQPIHAVLTTRGELDATNATYGADSITYGTSRFIGLESCGVAHAFCDAVSWVAGGRDLVLDWDAVHPGDHIRVLVAVPEPANHLLFAAGLAGLALTLRRRRSR